MSTVSSEPITDRQMQSIFNLLKREKDPGRRASTVTSLATLPGGTALLTTLYRTDANAQVRTAVLNALTTSQDRDALLELANQELNPRRRFEIQIRLDRLGPKP